MDARPEEIAWQLGTHPRTSMVMPIVPFDSSNEIKPRRRSQWQFGLKSLFVLLAITAWFTWQWTISRRREATIAELRSLYIPTFHDSVVSTRGAHIICTSLEWSDERIEEPIQPGLLSSITGWENQRGLTVFVSMHRFHPQGPLLDGHLKEISVLAQLPGLTTIILWDTNPNSKESPSVKEFKEAVRTRMPDVDIKHIYVEPRPVVVG